MKKILAILLSAIMAFGMSVTAFAADELGSDDFYERVHSKSQKVTKTVKGKRNATYRITGYYHAAEGQEVFKILNRERRAAGLPALEWEERLVQPAIQRALEMYVLQSHTRPDGSESFSVSSLSNGENLAGGDDNAVDVMHGWMNSPGHRDNILEPLFTSVAVACVETDKNVYWVQLFHQGKKSSSSTAAKQDTENTSAGAVTVKSMESSLNKAYKSDESVTSVLFKGVSSIPADALEAASVWGINNGKNVLISATTLTASGKSTQGQLSINPAQLTTKNAIKTGVYVDKASVASVASKFNNAAVIKLAHTGSYGGTVYVGAKVNLSGLDEKSLLFYRYDEKTGKVAKINLNNTGGYTISNNNFLRFATTKGGYIIVTDKAL